jgi:S-adenosylmethionine hydrolase
VSRLVDWSKLGVEISDPVKFNTPRAVVISDREIKGHVIHIDRFGNIITNITPQELSEAATLSGVRVRLGKHEATRLLKHFSEAEKDELFAFFGSAGFLELAVPRLNAARLVEARRGMEVNVVSNR